LAKAAEHFCGHKNPLAITEFRSVSSAALNQLVEYEFLRAKTDSFAVTKREDGLVQTPPGARPLGESKTKKFSHISSKSSL
jgi:hypothetical protein